MSPPAGLSRPPRAHQPAANARILSPLSMPTTSMSRSRSTSRGGKGASADHDVASARSSDSLVEPIESIQDDHSGNESASGPAATSAAAPSRAAGAPPSRSPTRSLRRHLSFRRSSGQEDGVDQTPTGQPVPSRTSSSIRPPTSALSSSPSVSDSPNPAGLSPSSPPIFTLKETRSLLSPLRRSSSRSFLSPFASPTASASTSPSTSTTDLVDPGARSASQASSPARSPQLSPAELDRIPRRGSSSHKQQGLKWPSEADTLSPPTSDPPSRSRLRSLSFTRKKANTDTPARKSLDQKRDSSTTSTATTTTSTKVPSTSAPPVPVFSAAYMRFNLSSSKVAASASSSSEHGGAQSTGAGHKSLKLPPSRLPADASPSSAVSTSSSQSSSSLTSRSSSFSSSASSFPVSPSASALDQSRLSKSKLGTPARSPLASGQHRQQLGSTSMGSGPSRLHDLYRSDSAATAHQGAPGRSGTRDSSTSSQLLSPATSSSGQALPRTSSFKLSIRRKMFGRSNSSDPPTPGLVDDSSPDSSKDEETLMASPRSPALGLEPVITDSGKMDFFGSIRHLPSEDGHGKARPLAATAMLKIVPSKPQVPISLSFPSLGVSDVESPQRVRTVPSKESPKSSPRSATGLVASNPATPKTITNRTSSRPTHAMPAQAGVPTPSSTHKKAAPSDESLDIGDELMMAVLSVQALETDSELANASGPGRTSIDSHHPTLSRPSMAESVYASPESLMTSLPPITTGGSSLGFSPPSSTAPLPPSSSFHRSNAARGFSRTTSSSRRCLTEAQMRDLDRQAALYAERARRERRPKMVHRPGLFASAKADDDDSEDDYGEEEGESEESAPAAPMPTATKTNGSTFAPRKRSGDRRRDGSQGGTADSAWKASSDEEDEEEITSRVTVRPTLPGLDVPAKRALYTCTLLKIHPHLAPQFLVPSNPTAQPLAAVALAAKNGSGVDSDVPANPLADVRFPRSTNPASYLVDHASTTSLARGGLRIALARAQVMRTLKTRKLNRMQEVEISWFQRKYGSELIAPDRVMAEMGKRPPVSPEALMKAPVANGGSAVKVANPMTVWVLRPRFAERMVDWHVVNVGKEGPSLEPQAVRTSKLPVLLHSPRVCALAGVPVPSWLPVSAAPKRFRAREVAGSVRSQGAPRRVASATGMNAASTAAPWLAPRTPPVVPLSVPAAPTSDDGAEAARLEEEAEARRRREAAIAQSQEALKVAAAKAAADAILVRQLKQALPGPLTQSVIAEENVAPDSDEEDLPLSMLQATRRDQQRRAFETQARQREMERRREDANRRALERNKTMLAEARERRAKGDQRNSVLHAHDYGAGDAVKGVGPSDSRRDHKEKSWQSAYAPEHPQAKRQGSVDDKRTTSNERSSTLLSVNNDRSGQMRSSSAVNLRASYYEHDTASTSERRQSRLPGPQMRTSPSSGVMMTHGGLLSPPAPASIRQRSPDRSSTMPTPAELGRGVSMASVAPLQQMQGMSSSGHGFSAGGLLATPPGWGPSGAAGSRTSTMMYGVGGPVPLATPSSPYSPNTSHSNLLSPAALGGAGSGASKGYYSGQGTGAHERMVAALSASNPQGMGYPPHQHMSVYGGSAPNLQALQLQQAAAMAAQQQQLLQAHAGVYGRPTSFMPMNMGMGMGMGMAGSMHKPLVALDARTLPASATVVRRSETLR